MTIGSCSLSYPPTPLSNAFQSLHPSSIGWLLWLTAYVTGVCESLVTAHHTLIHTSFDTESKTAIREREKVQAVLCEALEALNGVCGSVAGTSVVASVVTHLCLDQVLGLAHPSTVGKYTLTPLYARESRESHTRSTHPLISSTHTPYQHTLLSYPPTLFSTLNSYPLTHPLRALQPALRTHWSLSQQQQFLRLAQQRHRAPQCWPWSCLRLRQCHGTSRVALIGSVMVELIFCFKLFKLFN